jgi:hypothetical protein
LTIFAKDEIYVEDPSADTDLQDEDPARAIAGNLNELWPNNSVVNWNENTDKYHV